MQCLQLKHTGWKSRSCADVTCVRGFVRACSVIMVLRIGVRAYYYMHWGQVKCKREKLRTSPVMGFLHAVQVERNTLM